MDKSNAVALVSIEPSSMVAKGIKLKEPPDDVREKGVSAWIVQAASSDQKVIFALMDSLAFSKGILNR